MKITDKMRLDWVLERVVIGERFIALDPIPAFSDGQLLFQRRQAIDAAIRAGERNKI